MNSNNIEIYNNTGIKVFESALNTAQEPAKAVLRLTQRSARGTRSAAHVRVWHCGSSPRVLLELSLA